MTLAAAIIAAALAGIAIALEIGAQEGRRRIAAAGKRAREIDLHRASERDARIDVIARRLDELGSWATFGAAASPTCKACRGAGVFPCHCMLSTLLKDLGVEGDGLPPVKPSPTKPSDTTNLTETSVIDILDREARGMMDDMEDADDRRRPGHPPRFNEGPFFGDTGPFFPA